MENIKKETYTTLSYKNLKTAKNSENEIKIYFANRFINSIIYLGKDERGNVGFQIEYQLTNP